MSAKRIKAIVRWGWGVEEGGGLSKEINTRPVH